MVNTKFWTDNYISYLDPIEKLLFLYFLTNPATNISGTYELPLKNIALDTGLDKEMVEKILNRFSKEHKIFYYQGWVHIVNFVKHQNQGSPKVKKGIEVEQMAIPQHIKDYIDTLSKGTDTLSHPNTNSNTNLTKLNTGAPRTKKGVFTPLGAEVLREFADSVDPKNKTYYANTTQRGACDFLVAEYGLDKVLAAVKMLPAINQQKLYLRQITTPYELKENWMKIKNALIQNQPKKVKII